MTKQILLAVLLAVLVTACQESAILPKNDKKTEGQITLFTQLPSSITRVAFRNDIPESAAMNSMVYEYFYNGGGVAVGDINNDDLPDLYFVANLKENKLYKNKGNFQFEDITQTAGVEGSFGWSTGVTMADVNADGWLDIYVCKSGKGKVKDRENELFINNQDGTFRESAEEYGLNFPGFSTQAAFFDFDRDGDLDMFLLNHNTTPIQTNNPEQYKLLEDELAGDQLFRNDNGKFENISKQAGLINNPLGFGLGLSIGDLNNDGWPDIYVGNDYIEQDYLYFNNGDGTFSESLKTAIKHTSNFSMGTDIADFNNDGWPDIISLDMIAEDNYGIKTSMSGMNPAAFQHAVDHGFHYQYMFNALQLNNGNNSFSEIAHLAGISNTDWSWTPLLADFDNDGWKDLFVTNGLKRDFRNNDFRNYKLKRLEKAKQSGENMKMVMEELVAQTPQRKKKNYFFKNNADLTFSNRSKDWGITQPSFSNGAAYSDLDGDGDLDLVVNNIDEEAYILKNNATQNYLQFELQGPPGNSFGIGTKIKIEIENHAQYIENFPTRGYQSTVSNELHFGLGMAELVNQIEVTWPDGKRQKLENIKSNQRIKLKHELATSIPFSNKSIKQLFTDITAKTGLNHRHIENEYNDFKKESLLPHKMSQFGPALAVGDANGDGLEDYFVGAAKGHAAEVYYQQNDGTFLPSESTIWQKERGYEDVDAAFFDADNDGDLDLYVASGGNEFEANSPFLQDRLYLNDGKKQFVKNDKLLPKMPTSSACVKPFDFDQDGDEDLFVGGRLVPGKYPFPANSYLLQNDGGLFKNVTKEVAPELVKPGMVSDALWTDFDLDGQTDLMLVGEWMPITLFKNHNGRFASFAVDHFAHSSGWWSSIEGADFDGDGDMDYLLGNLGLNYKYHASAEAPFEIYCHDFDENGSLDIVLGYYNQDELFPLRGRECSSNQMPFLKEKFPDYHTFGTANLEEIYGAEKLAEALHLKAWIFASVLLKNEGTGLFNIEELPVRAQVSSINSTIIHDVDGDGFLDVILAGNLFQSEVETPRNDASVGLVLKNNGKGGFDVMAPLESGLYVGQDVKKLALIHLGNRSASRMAFLVGNNNDQLQLIRINHNNEPTVFLEK